MPTPCRIKEVQEKPTSGNMGSEKHLEKEVGIGTFNEQNVQKYMHKNMIQVIFVRDNLLK